MNPIKQGFVFALSDFINVFQAIFVRSENLYKLLFINSFSDLRWKLGTWRAWKNFDISYRSVPAYHDFIDKRGGPPRVNTHWLTPDLSVIPEMDKENYVKQYSNEDRVRGGKLPSRGVMVDESSGSSGKPTSWVRGWSEREISKQMLQLAYHSVLGGDNAFVINAFALGAWATGLNVSMFLAEITVLKSTGPDIDKIINTLLEFGPRYHYIIMGYPPFLKSLADDERVDWSQYQISVAYGGEGMSESQRDYLLKTFQNVYGSYGASDLEINIAAENAFTVRLRRLMLQHEGLRDALMWTDLGVTPMLFQYNPLAYYIETNLDGELLVTQTRRTNISPKIRYNIHDRGHVWQFKDVWAAIQQFQLEHEFTDIGRVLHLPIMFFYGRSDMSIDYFGANVTPDSIRDLLFQHAELAPKLNTFRLESYIDEQQNSRMRLCIELSEGKKNDFTTHALAQTIFAQLAQVNRDFANAYYNTAPHDMKPEFHIYEFGHGPFKGANRKIKAEYVKTNVEYDKL